MIEIKKEWLDAATKAIDNSSKTNVIVAILENGEPNIIPLENSHSLIKAVDRNELSYRSGKLYKLLFKINWVHCSELIEEGGFMNGDFVEHTIYIVKIIDLA